MARPLRLELAGGLYHVTSRGDGREGICLDDTDREVWLTVFAQVCARFNWVCHAWCQMSNHYHLVIETPEPNLAEGMRQLNGVYTQRFNRRQGNLGTPILFGVNIDPEQFIDCATNLMKQFGSAIGAPAHLTELCAARQVKYLRGVGAARRVFEGRAAGWHAACSARLCVCMTPP